jgi:serine/threonine protein kinase
VKSHPNVIQVLGVCQTPPGIVMEFMERGSLLSLLKDQVKLDSSQIDSIILGIAQGLAHLHYYGIVHR